MRCLHPRCILTLAGWRLRGRSIYRLYKELLQREHWSRQQWEEYQEDLMRSFVRHCYDNVLFYRRRFQENNLQPGDITTVSQMVKIPILTKRDVRNNVQELIADNYKDKKLTELHTTGSTGVPLACYADLSRSEFTLAGMWRIYSRCGWEPGEKISSIWGFSAKYSKMGLVGLWLRDFVSGHIHFSAWQANNDDFGKWCKRLKKEKPTVLVCYSSSGSRFAHWLLDHGETLSNFKGIYCTAEKLYDHQRTTMEKAFGCKVYDYYGCIEVGHIACECEKGNMHIYPDMVVVETIKSEQVVGPLLVVTGLRNWAMPFLRYSNGDSIQLRNDMCTCGRQSPLMELKITRLADVFRLANGKEYPSLYFILRLYKTGFEGVELFQYHQDKLDHIYLRIVKNAKFTEQTKRNLEAAADEIQEHIEQQAKVEILYVDYIEQSSTAKHYYAKSDVKRGV